MGACHAGGVDCSRKGKHVSKLTSSDLAEIEERLRAMRVALTDRAADSGADHDRSAEHLAQASGTGSTGSAAFRPAAVTENTPHGRGGDKLTPAQVEQLRSIDLALQRIEFGVGCLCTQCGDQIALSRLRALPAATLCAMCAASLEGKEDQQSPWQDR